MLSNLGKAALAALAAPVGLAADILTLPASSMDPHRGPFENTEALIDKSKAAFNAAIEPEKKDASL